MVVWIAKSFVAIGAEPFGKSMIKRFVAERLGAIRYHGGIRFDFG